MRMRFTVGAALLCMSGVAAAQDSAAYAQMSRTAWNAFECAALASTMEWRPRHDQLVTFGHSQGGQFLAALAAGRIERYDVFSTTPSAFPKLEDAPSADFVLGRVYEMAKTFALRDVITSENRGHTDVHKTLATAKYEAKGCKALS